MMNYPCYDAAATTPWCYNGEAPAITAAVDTCSFADLMIPDYSTDDLFELAWEQEAGAGASAASTTTMMQPAASWLWSPPREVRSDHSPSEDEMAAWLCAIVRGDELVSVNIDDGGRQQQTAGRGVPEERPPSATSTTTTTTGKKEKLPTTEGMDSTKQEMRKPRAAGTSRRSQHGQAHKLTEKRRRHKINERFRTLQQLVPGCDDKSNQAATLDKTIQYMKSLQHHVQYNQAVPPPVAMPMPAAPAMVLAPAPTTMVVPLGAMLQLPGYPAPAVPVMTMPAAAAAPLYPAAAAAAPGGAGHRQGWRSSKGKGGSIRSLRPKH